MPPLLSLCIPTYNRADWLKACLDSCIPQVEALPEGLVEIVVSDNASSDGTPELLASYAAQHPSLVLNCNEKNVNADNFDIVVQRARGDYAWLMGDDDAFLPGAVAHVVDLIQKDPCDIYIPHVVIDSMDPHVRRMEWFDKLPRVHWDLSDTEELAEYMSCARSASAVFSFISVLIFRREPWLETVNARPSLSVRDWPQVATGLEYIKRHGRLRVIPEALVNYHCSTCSWGEQPWARSMVDLRGFLQMADTFFPGDSKLFHAFMGTLRKNHGDGWIAQHRISAPDAASWEESKRLLLRAGFDPLKIAAVDLGAELLAMRKLSAPVLDAKTLTLADLGFIARGARRTVVVLGRRPLEHQDLFLRALTEQSHADLWILHPRDHSPEYIKDSRYVLQPVDLAAFAEDDSLKSRIQDALKSFAPDLWINLDQDRHPAWDILASTVAPAASLAFHSLAPVADPQVVAWLDSHYTHWLEDGSVEALMNLFGLSEPEVSKDSPLAIHKELPVKLNLGCGGEHLPGWVNVDKFPAAHPDVVHDLEKFPWPFADDSAEEVLLKHVLEHLGRDSDTFLGIIRELYRVCRPGATVRILVPHPRHQDFIQDPTHVRPVVPEMFQHFSLAINKAWAARGLPGTPLAQYLGVDFEIVSSTLTLDPYWDAEYRAGRIGAEELERIARSQNNVVQTSEVVLKAVKPSTSPSPQRISMRWEGSQFVYHSLAHVNRQICLGLLKSQRVDLSLIPYEPDQFDGAASPFAPLAACVRKALPGAASVHVRHQWPPHFEPPAEGAWVMIQPWEFGGIPAQWVPPMRDLVDEIWVPTRWVKDCYVKSGIPEEKVAVVPNGVDTTLFTPIGDRFPLRTSKGFKFLFLGGTIYRKGIDVLLDVYVNTFRASDDVCLVIKGQAGMTYQGTELDAKIAEIAQDPNAPEIEYRVEAMDEPALVSLYRACDAFVLPYRGEGFGLPIAEAMACGLPVIVTGRGAAADFVREAWAYPVDSLPHAIPNVDLFSPSPCGFWLEEPDPQSLAAHLRRAFEHPDEAREKGRKGRAYAMAELGWDKPVEKILERLQALSQRVPCRIGFTGSAPAKATRCLFHLPADPHSIQWIQVLLAYANAFMPGDAVALGLRAELASHDELGQTVVGVMQKAGYEKFPDVMLLESDDEIRDWAQSGGDVIDLEDRASWKGHPLLDRLERSLLLFEKR